MMNYQTGPMHRPAEVTITPFSDAMIGHTLAHIAAPTSGSYEVNVAMFYPVNVPEPFVVSKPFWLNGATASTDKIDLGIYQLTDPATSRMDLLHSTGATLASGANVVQEGIWRCSGQNVTSAGSSTDATTYATSSVTMKAGKLYLMSVENSHGSSATAVSTISGGPTFTSRSTTQYNSNLNRTSIWSAAPTVDYVGTLTIDFGATTQTGAVWSLDEVTGVDTSTNDGIVQNATGTGNSTTPLATLAAFGSANNATFGAHGQAANNAVTPGSGFTEISDVGAATPPQRIETAWRVDNSTAVGCTITSAQWGSCAVELKADANPFTIPMTQPGVPNIYMAMTCNGVTTTVFRSSPLTAYCRATGMLQLTSGAFPLPTNCTPVVVSTSRAIPVAGFSLRSLIG